MSYDLFFLRRGEAPPADALREHFSSRPRYKEQESQFWYENEDTGVYFSFDLAGGSDEGSEAAGGEADDRGDGLASAGLSFNINFFRPHTFGLEAERELTALVNRFALLVDDPQNEGMGRGPYSGEGFLRGWNAGNRFGHYAILSQNAGEGGAAGPRSFDTLPKDTLERTWRWNYGRAALQDEMGESVFVPGIRLLRHEGGVKTFVVWGDAIPEAVPDVDLVVLARDELAPRRFFTRRRDFCVAGYEELRPVLKEGRRVPGETPYTLFRYPSPPVTLTEFFRARLAFAGQLDGLAFDSVLTHEVLDEVRRAVHARGTPGGS